MGDKRCEQSSSNFTKKKCKGKPKIGDEPAKAAVPVNLEKKEPGTEPKKVPDAGAKTEGAKKIASSFLEEDKEDEVVFMRNISG